MAAGEYVSVRSQVDSEQAAFNLERTELASDDLGRAPGTVSNLRQPRPRSSARERGRGATQARARRREHVAQGPSRMPDNAPVIGTVTLVHERRFFATARRSER